MHDSIGTEGRDSKIVFEDALVVDGITSPLFLCTTTLFQLEKQFHLPTPTSRQTDVISAKCSILSCILL